VSDGIETIVLGGGCFWCTEACLALVEGVVSATPGYAGGTTGNPDYGTVCRGNTGHAEVVEVKYDPSKVELDEILAVFFASHDPTSLNRQGADVGTQYRSIILYTTGEQKRIVEQYIDGLAEVYGPPVVTEVKQLERFYPAESYHQRYFEKNPGQGYCKVVISPKVDKIKSKLGAV
jgi:peptide-methionine (S)-S-oxide reductase